mmetsp:Transcript_42600/g.69284  ORF Transcript_42600/g.69284 Transcript_42600/m.69284 type:complete len:334 (+) Transcript_42600:78-1079(+)
MLGNIKSPASSIIPVCSLSPKNAVGEKKHSLKPYGYEPKKSIGSRLNSNTFKLSEYKYKATTGKSAHLFSSSIFSSPLKTSTDVFSDNAARRAMSARKIKKIREAIEVARTAKKRPTLKNYSNLQGSKLNFQAPQFITTPLRKKTTNHTLEATATPLTSALKAAYTKAEEQHPAQVENIPSKKEDQDIKSPSKEQDENDAPRNLNEDFSLCDSQTPGHVTKQLLLPDVSGLNLGDELSEYDQNSTSATRSSFPEESTAKEAGKSSKSVLQESKNSRSVRFVEKRQTPLSSRMMSRLDLIISNPHTAPQYGRVNARAGRTPVRRSLRIRRAGKK